MIRIDRLQGGLDAKRWPVAPSGKSLFWAGLNKGKKSVALDTSSPEGREIAGEIITAPGPDAGLFITNLKVKGWTDHDTLSARRGDMITVTLSGDRNGRPAVDYTVNPALGIPDITGPEGHPDPVANALPAWDMIAGQQVVSAVLGAERHRLRTQAGQAVQMSLKDVAAASIGHLGLIGEAATRQGARGKSGNALYGAYGADFVCACGGRVMVIGLTGRQWSGLLKITGTQEAMQHLAQTRRADLSQEGTRWELRHDISRILAPWFAARRIDDFAADFDRASLTWSRFRTVKDALAHDPDLSDDNPMFSVLNQPGLGRFPVPGLPATFSQAPRTAPEAAPELGAHTEEVLADVVGLSDGQIGRLFDAGTVQSPDYRAQSAA